MHVTPINSSSISGFSGGAGEFAATETENGFFLRVFPQLPLPEDNSGGRSDMDVKLKLREAIYIYSLDRQTFNLKSEKLSLVFLNPYVMVFENNGNRRRFDFSYSTQLLFTTLLQIDVVTRLMLLRQYKRLNIGIYCVKVETFDAIDVMGLLSNFFF